MPETLADKILKCCDEEPVIYDLAYNYISVQPFNRYMIMCENCGHHIHTGDSEVQKAIDIWNNSLRIFVPEGSGV